MRIDELRSRLDAAADEVPVSVRSGRAAVQARVRRTRRWRVGIGGAVAVATMCVGVIVAMTVDGGSSGREVITVGSEGDSSSEPTITAPSTATVPDTTATTAATSSEGAAGPVIEVPLLAATDADVERALANRDPLALAPNTRIEPVAKIGDEVVIRYTGIARDAPPLQFQECLGVVTPHSYGLGCSAPGHANGGVMAGDGSGDLPPWILWDGVPPEATSVVLESAAGDRDQRPIDGLVYFPFDEPAPLEPWTLTAHDANGDVIVRGDSESGFEQVPLGPPAFIPPEAEQCAAGLAPGEQLFTAGTVDGHLVCGTWGGEIPNVRVDFAIDGRRQGGHRFDECTWPTAHATGAVTYDIETEGPPFLLAGLIPAKASGIFLTFPNGTETTVEPLWSAPRSIFAIVVAELPLQPEDLSFVDHVESADEPVTHCVS
jgi:hypothetical protein